MSPRRLWGGVSLTVVGTVILGLISSNGLSAAAVAQTDAAAFSPARLQDTIPEGQPPSNQAALDVTFNPGSFTSGQVSAALLQPDGKLIIAGTFNKVHGVARHGIARLHADGTLDQSFDAGAGAATGGVTAIISEGGIIQQPDGKLIVTGLFTTFNGAPRNAVARLNPDGSLDTSFNPARGISSDGIDDGNGNAVSPGEVRSVILQADGKVILLGSFGYVITAPGSSTQRYSIARFHNDGTFDSSFAPGVGFQFNGQQASVFGAAQRTDGKIYAFGSFNSYGGQSVTPLVRVNPDGTLDQNFNPPTIDAFLTSGVFVQQDARLVLFGSFTAFAGAPANGLVRLFESGAVDGSFTPATFTAAASQRAVRAIAEQSDGHLIVAGEFHSVDGHVANNIARLTPSGTRDPSFNGAGAGPSGLIIGAVLIRPSDGKIFAGGYFSTFAGLQRNSIAWLTTAGLPDETFAGLGGATDSAPQIYTIVAQPDGKILVGGSFSLFNAAPHSNLVRLKADGSIDPTFDPNFGTEGSVRAIALQPDGKIIIAGVIRAVNGVRVGGIARLHPDGTLDATFDAGTGADLILDTVARDSAGNLFVGGTFSTFNGAPRSRIAKLGPNGALDTTFNPGTGFIGRVFAIAPDEAGNILVGGSFIRYQGTTANRYVRLSATSAQRTSAATHPGANGIVRAIQRTAEGKFYVGGDFTTFAGLPSSKIARLNSDGLSEGFSPQTLNMNVYALGLHGTKVVLGGAAPEGSPRLLRLTEAATVDNEFQPGSGIAWSPANAYSNSLGPVISSIAVDSGGRTLIGGTFNRYNGAPRVCLARLTSSALNFTAVSRKLHGAVPFDIPLPLTGSSGVECRSGGAGNNYEIVFNFGGSVSFGNAAVTAGTGAVTSVSGSGTNTATVALSGVSSGQRIVVTLSSVTDGMITSDVAVPMGILIGDTTGNGSVTASDIGQVKGQSGQPVTTSNFRTDVNVSGGSISASDIGFVKSRAGTSLPP